MYLTALKLLLSTKVTRHSFYVAIVITPSSCPIVVLNVTLRILLIMYRANRAVLYFKKCVLN